MQIPELEALAKLACTSPDAVTRAAAAEALVRTIYELQGRLLRQTAILALIGRPENQTQIRRKTVVVK